MNYRALDADAIVEKIARLHQRIEERFPGRGLAMVCADLQDLALETRARLELIGRPNWWLRGAIIGIIVLVLVGSIAVVSRLIVLERQITLTEFLSALEAGLNDLLLIGAALFFLVTLENRIKRHRSLDRLHELRAMSHVIDMHQLTKDPTRLLLAGPDTPSSPKEVLTPFELQRYLDYCSEMLSLIGKVAALYVQDFDDGVVIATVNEIEELTNDLSRKIWQKIMIIHSFEQATQAIQADATPSGVFTTPPPGGLPG